MNAPHCPHGIPIADGVVCADCAGEKAALAGDRLMPRDDEGTPGAGGAKGEPDGFPGKVTPREAA